MPSPLTELVGKRVAESRVIRDYLQLLFEGSAGLRVLNDYSINRDDGAAALNGRVLVRVVEDSSRVELEFDGCVTLAVSLEPNAYHCPEAMILDRDGRTPVVWT